MNVYVAEHLLNISAEIDPNVFFERFIAGFVTHSPDPPYSTCGCADNEEETCSFLLPATNLNGLGFFPPLSNITHPGISNCTQFPDDEWQSLYNGLVDISIDNASCLAAPYSPDMPGGVCQCSVPTQCQIGMTSQPLPPAGGQPAVTVWYNNQVGNRERERERERENEKCKLVPFSLQPYHTIAASLNAFYNLYLNEQLGGERFTITVINHPLPRNLDSQVSACAVHTCVYM